MHEYVSSLTTALLNALPSVLISLVIFAASYYAGVLLSRFLKTVLDKRNADPGVSHLLSQIVKWAVISFGVIAALQRFFDVTAFLAGLGILGFAIGFALQNIMQNFVSGVILLVQQPFKAGDFVNAAGFDGTVLAIDLRTTEMKTLDGRIAFLPNADVLSQPIINYTRANLRRVELPVGVAYDSDPETVRTTVLHEIQKVDGYVDSPTPLVLFHTFGASSIDFTVYFWVDTAQSNIFLAKDTALTFIKKAFEKKNIEIPFPIQTLRHVDEKPAPRARKTGKTKK